MDDPREPTPLHPRPADEEITAYLELMCRTDTDYFEETLAELEDAIDHTLEQSEPRIWAYGRLVNYLTKGVDTSYLIHVCASALWKVHGQENADIRSICESDKDKKGDGTQV